MKKWIIVAILIGFVVGYAGSQYVENRRYKRFFEVEVSNPDTLTLVKNPTSVTGGDYVIVLNATSISGGTVIWADIQPVDWGTMELQFRITGTP